MLAFGEHMEVVGSTAATSAGWTDVIGDDIELAKLDLGGGLKHHLIPLSWGRGGGR